ncbi:MAG: hypothetical protein ACRD0H_11655 [Actinomycetes bacterium]
MGLSTGGLQQWLVSNAVTVTVVLIALACLVASLKGDAGKVMSVIGLTLASLAMVALGTIPGAVVAASKFVAGLFGIGAGQ